MDPPWPQLLSLVPNHGHQWVKNIGLDPRYGEENEQALNYPGESANSIKSTTRKGASDIHLTCELLKWPL